MSSNVQHPTRSKGIAGATGPEAGERSEHGAGQGAAASPRPVTRGESIPATHDAEARKVSARGVQFAKVDWLNATFKAPDRYSVAQFIDLLSRMFRRPLQGVEARGLFGFDQSVKLFARVGSAQFAIGCLAFGGESQKGRWMLQITGAGCPAVRDWHKMARLLRALDARLTRVDLAVDYLDGQHTVDDAVRMHAAGAFSTGGRPPSTSVAGDWLDGSGGRTLYVGKSTNGKVLRVYEKGKQLGDLSSPWVRFEVQLGNRDRVIPFEVLTARDRFLAGCYPALADMLQVAAESIDTTRTEGGVTLSHLMFHLKRSYGKLLAVIGEHLNPDASELIHSVKVMGAPRRLKPCALSAGLTWEQLLSQVTRIKS